jgi:hypothetical protein
VDEIVSRKGFLRLLIESFLIHIISHDSLVFETLANVFKIESNKSAKIVSLATFILKHFKPYLFDAEGGFLGSQQTLRYIQLFQEFYKRSCRTMLRLHSRLQTIEAKSKHYYESKGDLNEKQTSFWAEAKNDFEAIKEPLQLLADQLGSQFPELVSNTASPTVVEGKIIFAEPLTNTKNLISEVFDSEEDRAFYEDIISLIDIVPKDVLPSNSSPIKQNEVCDNVEIQNEIDPDFNFCGSFSGQKDDKEKINLSFDSYVETLLKMHTSSMADKAAVEFCYVNSKFNRSLLAEVFIFHSMYLICLELIRNCKKQVGFDTIYWETVSHFRSFLSRCWRKCLYLFTGPIQFFIEKNRSYTGDTIKSV